MSAAEESPAQRAARLRRERREAKIKADGSARLDKITSLSGRTPASTLREDSPPSLSDSSPTPGHRPQTLSKPSSPLPPPPNVEDQAPENLKAQEEYLRAFLRSQQPLDQPAPAQDPANLLGSLFGGGSGDNNTFSGDGPAFNLADIASAFGVPPSISTFFFNGDSQPASPGEQRIASIWKLVHVVFSLAIGIYLLSLFRSSVSTYGTNPPPPATARNPFILFLTGEVVLSGTRALTSAREGQLRNARAWIQILGKLVRDGRIAVFVLGAGMWLLGEEEFAVKS
ncbi:conserved hypothetical protein [Histoplasma capsulatum G186AR]|uniref:GET complex subunit GET2 n=2 Tax=Ajellomyces capsulatus TaxID=5037 RepID=C0NJX3_AJECG|nr:uncharacterized protein HCBG_03453 [Histoplasma capsulatum G186AR]XP_045288695.1 uncharacterized protein HCBG_03503 [Histoplasma capsulatum G186AR]KAG5299501.1 nitrositive-stress induced transcript [Histoplasma capsulatum]EEH08164.1 conserved hypothetical protein [Histoplasma capsulatum G186AR]EEH08214.1 conserved hypothetical protein [Histoplasma capsulatum G186AR]QSS67901.1 nitrositive-stress induced transcript [Histoplasma capsulatum G186AR]